MNNFNFKNQKGFTLVETLVALLIFAFAVTAMLVVTGQGVFNTNFAKNKITAGFLAQEGIEFVHYIRDTIVMEDPVNGWTLFGDHANDFCTGAGGSVCTVDPYIFDLSMLGGGVIPNFDLILPPCSQANCMKVFYDDGLYTMQQTGTETLFSRFITIELIRLPSPSTDSFYKVTSTVTWDQGTNNHRVSVSENLFNWNAIAP